MWKAGGTLNQAACGVHSTLELIKNELGNTSDLSVRECRIGVERIPVFALWLCGITEKRTLNENIIVPLIAGTRNLHISACQEPLHELLSHSIVTTSEGVILDSVEEALLRLLAGWTLVLAGEGTPILAFDTRGYETRSIEEPASSTVTRGPRDGFVESLEVNSSLIRRRIRNKALRIEVMKVGTVTCTDIAMIYLHDRVVPDIVQKVRNRLKNINIDAVLESQYIEEMIKDHPSSFFPTVYSTERPDDITGGVLEGRVAILVDGTPFGLIVPCTLFHLLKTPEDYYLAYPVATFIRWLRMIGFFFTLLLPSLYVGILTFHPEMVPPKLLSSILSSREGVPFPLLLEALIMELTFEMLREASIRMPRTIGSAISIVGALVIGESAVKAGIISSPAIIVVAGTAIASFTIPSIELSGAIRLMRFFMLAITSLLGLYGIFIGLMVLCTHLASLKSVGIPYLSPVAPFRKEEAKKTFIRIPWWTLRQKKR
ncbi:spore germination protein [Paenibacillus thalictri]|uniref:Spore germination protein n=1 Tax=Paenibacillus thalictri TaxID=2527873 RepID=A0A4Q9DE06_9BACL|nr:spore germination protein [Paenibacillus thalictri]TBL69671.1 spore germination protein [Paenibacillus thalictri]